MLERLRTRFAEWQAYRETIFQLECLDRRTLLDAGITPASIRDRARAAVRARR